MLTVFASLTVVFALAAVYLGAKLLWKGSWILGFVRGALGFSLLVVSAILIFAALEIFSFNRWEAERPVATLSFEQTDTQVYKVTFVVPEEGKEEIFELYGDQWQMDARIIRWKSWLRSFGAEPGYKLDRLSGRYYSLEDERTKKRTVHKLVDEEKNLDIWAWVHEHGRFVPMLEAAYGSATYLPMVDGGLYQVRLAPTGLSAKAMNSIAEEALEYWQ